MSTRYPPRHFTAKGPCPNCGDHDLLCVVSPSTRVGIPANNIPHVKKKIGGQTFGQVELGMPRHHRN